MNTKGGADYMQTICKADAEKQQRRCRGEYNKEVPQMNCGTPRMLFLIKLNKL